MADMNEFNDRISERAADTSKPALAHQSRGRGLEPAEEALATALMEIFGAGIHDFEKVAAELKERKVLAPRSGRTDWDLALLEEELSATNAAFDAAYAESGYGA